MASNYPSNFDTFPLPNSSDKANAGAKKHSELHRDEADAIEAIEATLGLNPQGEYDTVAERLDAIGNGSGGGESGGSSDADEIYFNDTGADALSGINNVQDALKKLDETVTSNESAIGTHIADGTSVHSASAISFSPTGTLSSTNVQDALEELAAEGGGGGPGPAEGVPITGGVMTGRLGIESADMDPSLASGDDGGLRLGTQAGQHLALGNAEIQSKLDATTAGVLNLNPHGGAVRVAAVPSASTDIVRKQELDALSEDIEGLEGDLDDHIAADDPHPQYLTETSGNALYDTLGSAASAESDAKTYTDTELTAHEQDDNAHPQYLTETEADAAYEPIGAAESSLNAAADYTDDVMEIHENADDPHPQYETGTEAEARASVTEASANSYTDSVVGSHINDASGAHPASAISFTPTGTVSSNNVQAAIAEVANEYAMADTTLAGQIVGVANDLNDHITDSTAAHAASAISYNGSSNLSTDNVESALDELDSEKVAKTGDIMSGNLTMPSPGSIKHNGFGSGVANSDASAIVNVQMPRWHNLLGFKRFSPEGERFDGETWSSVNVDNIFDRKGQTGVTACDSTYSAFRITWTGLTYTYITQVVLAFAYVTGNPARDILIERSPDGETWTTLNSITGVTWNTYPYVIQLGEGGLAHSDSYFRITITRTAPSGSIIVAQIEGLTPRWGNQGLGPEVDSIWSWDVNKNVTAQGTLTVPSAPTISTHVARKLEVDAVSAAVTDHINDAVDAHDASAISFVPTGSVAATTVQTAIAEVASEYAAADLVLDAAIDDVASDLSSHISDAIDAHNASAISFNPTGSVAATTVQGAIAEVATEYAAADTTLQNNINTVSTNLSNHLSDATDAHDASAISFVPTGSIAASNVQTALAEVAADYAAADTTLNNAITTVSTNLSNHINDGTDAHDASAISFNNSLLPAWLTSTQVQGAIAEVASEIDGRISEGDVESIITALNNWESGDPEIDNPDIFTSDLIITRHLATGSVVASKIGAGEVNASHIAATSIQAGHIEAGAIHTEHFDAESITTEALAANAVTAEKIAANTITADQIAAGTITGTEISAGTITSSHIGADQINATHIAANAITASELNANAVTTAKLNALAVTAEKIAANAITAVKINAGAVETDKLAAGAVTALKIAADAIDATHISAGAVETEHIEAGAIETDKLAALAVTADKIAANTITATQIAANAITASELAANAVEAVHIKAGEIDSTHIEANAIQAIHIAADQIEAGHIAAGAIQTEHLDSDIITSAHITSDAIEAEHIAANAIESGHITADAIKTVHIDANAVIAEHIAGGTITGNKISATTTLTVGSGTNKIIIAGTSSDSTTLIRSGTTGYGTGTGFYLDASGRFSLGTGLTYNGAGTLSITGYATDGELTSGLAGKISTGGAAADVNANATTISGGKITTGTLDGNRINAASTITVGTGTNKITLAGTASDSTTLIRSGTTGYGTGSGFYMDGSGRFSLGTGLTYNGSGTLTISGYATNSALTSGLSGKISTGGAAADVNANATTISGGKITTGSITATQIQGGTITGDKIAVNAITARELLVSPSSQNLIINGGFENEPSLTGWIGIGTATAARTSTEVRSGNYSASIVLTSSSPGGLHQVATSNVMPLTTYTIQAWLKYAHDGATVGTHFFRIEQYNNSGVPLDPEYIDLNEPISNSEIADTWNLRSFTYTTPEDCYRIRIQIYLYGSSTGTLYIDDVACMPGVNNILLSDGLISGNHINALSTVTVGTGTNKITLAGTSSDSTTVIKSGSTGYGTGSGFYMDASGRFSLGTGLTYNGSGTLTISGYATDGELSSGLSGKINSGGAAADVNANSTTISGGKINAGSTITVGTGATKITLEGTGTPTSTIVRSGTTGYGTGTGFYMDASGRFSLGGTLTYNGSGTLTINGYATDGELSTGLAGKISSGGAAADVNANSTTISGGKITTGSIQTAQLAAGAVTASKMNIGDFNNYWTNPRFSADGSMLGTESSETPPLGNARTLDVRDHVAPSWESFPIREGEQWVIEYTAKRTAGSLSLQPGIYKNDTGQWWHGTRNGPTVVVADLGDGWERRRTVETIVASGPEPNTPTTGRVFFHIGQSFPDYTTVWHVADLNVYRRNAAELIVDGSIKANHIEAGTITGDKINASTTLTVGTGTNKITLAGTSSDTTTLIRSGTTTYGAGTGFYIDASGRFSLGTGLTYDGAGTLTINGYATDSELTSGLSGKISSGGAAADVNANSTTISGGKITTGTLDGDRISASSTITVGTGATKITIAGTGTPSTTVIKSGSTGYGTGTGFYMDASGRFSLGTGLTYNGSGTLTISGYATDGELSSGLAGKISSGGAAADVNANSTTISGSKITTGSITADQIDGGTITGDKISSSTTLTVGTGSNKITITGTSSDSTTLIKSGSTTYGGGTGFYIDGSGRFSLGNALTYNGAGALNLKGEITAESLAIPHPSVAGETLTAMPITGAPGSSNIGLSLDHPSWTDADLSADIYFGGDTNFSVVGAEAHGTGTNYGSWSLQGSGSTTASASLIASNAGRHAAVGAGISGSTPEASLTANNGSTFSQLLVDAGSVTATANSIVFDTASGLSGGKLTLNADNTNGRTVELRDDQGRQFLRTGGSASMPFSISALTATGTTGAADALLTITVSQLTSINRVIPIVRTTSTAGTSPGFCKLHSISGNQFTVRVYYVGGSLCTATSTTIDYIAYGQA